MFKGRWGTRSRGDIAVAHWGGQRNGTDPTSMCSPGEDTRVARTHAETSCSSRSKPQMAASLSLGIVIVFRWDYFWSSSPSHPGRGGGPSSGISSPLPSTEAPSLLAPVHVDVPSWRAADTSSWYHYRGLRGRGGGGGHRPPVLCRDLRIHR